MPAKGAAIERTAVSERTALERIRAIATVRDGTLAGIGDDAAVLATTARTVVCHDMLVDGVHFRRDATPMRDLGHKALAVNLSDLAAMGASPLAALVGIALPPDGLTTDELGDLYAGMEALAAAHGVSIAGGDTTRGPGLTLAVTALGTLGPGDEALTRSGGRPGDLLCVTGPLGAAAAGLHLADGRVDAGATDHVATLIAALRRPEPRVAEGRLLAAAGAHTAMDISDGLALDAERLAAASGLCAHIDLGRVPLASGVREVAGALHHDPHRFAATGGEDYELLFAAPASTVDDLTATLPRPPTVIGRLDGGDGLVLTHHGRPVTPSRLGWEV